MKEFLSSHLTAARSLAGIAHEMLVESRNAAATKVSDLRSQVDDLWQAADDMIPRAQTKEIIRRLERAVDAMKNRDVIDFPKPVKA